MSQGSLGVYGAGDDGFDVVVAFKDEVVVVKDANFGRMAAIRVKALARQNMF